VDREKAADAREAALDVREAEQQRTEVLQERRGRSQDDREHSQGERTTLQNAREAEQDERDRLREMFIAVLGHDLRNPLGAIALNAAALLKGGTLRENESKSVARVARSADRMLRMIQQLLDFTRTRLGGGMAIDRRACDLNEIVRQVVEDTQPSHPDRAFQLREASNPTGSWDRDRLSQLCSNLIGNAIEHGQSGTPIRVSVHDDSTYVTIVVENQGPTIPSSVLPALFDPFRPGQRLRSEGLGLGLYISRQIALGHGGDIEVTSSEEDGTRFSVKLPR
jgi:signal transduction histidine kinase